MERIKKFLWLLVFTPSTVFADSILGELGSKDAAPARTANDVTELITRLKDIILGTAGIIAVAMIIWGGITLATSGGNEERTAKGKKILSYSIGGLIFIIFTQFLIIVFIKILGGEVG